MESRHWTGDDNRDGLTHDTELDACDACGAEWNEPCAPDCPCSHCIGKRAREAARRAVEGPEAA